MLNLRSLIAKTKQYYCNRRGYVNMSIKMSVAKIQQRSNNATNNY
jgi:hypothetical protein